MNDARQVQQEPVQQEPEGEGSQAGEVAQQGSQEEGEPQDSKEEETISIEQLNTELENSIKKLKKHLESKLIGLTFENNSIQNICAKISELNLLGEFDKSFYNSLNNYFKKNGNPSKLMDGEVLSQVIYSQIINGKYGTDWPSESQKKLIQESLGLSVGESISSAFGFGSKGGRKIIKNKRKYIRRKNIKK